MRPGADTRLHQIKLRVLSSLHRRAVAPYAEKLREMELNLPALAALERLRCDLVVALGLEPQAEPETMRRVWSQTQERNLFHGAPPKRCQMAKARAMGQHRH